VLSAREQYRDILCRAQDAAGDHAALPAQAAENAELVARVRDLQQQLTQRHHGTGPDTTALHRKLAAAEQELAQLKKESEKDLLGISNRAVNLLSQAQLSADTTVAEAEQYARDLVLSAREQYRDILRRAQDAAATAAGDLAALPAQAQGYTQPIPEIEYVRTYTQIAHKQLQSVVEALAAEIDRLGDLPHLPPPVSATAENNPAQQRPPGTEPAQPNGAGPLRYPASASPTTDERPIRP
jgi:hypothetical protein